MVVGTAGHIDHGKSRLVRTLTGIDPDRLPEEKARGMTIDLGFAHTRIDDCDIWFVDVPGQMFDDLGAAVSDTGDAAP